MAFAWDFEGKNEAYLDEIKKGHKYPFEDLDRKVWLLKTNNTEPKKIGIVEYHLLKDNSWIGEEFSSVEERNTITAKLEKFGYKYKVTYYELIKFEIENPNLTAFDYLNKLIQVLNKINNG
jgi:hypothetical protein